MKKFHSICTAYKDTEKLKKEYNCANQFGLLRLSREALFYDTALRIQYIPLSHIQQVYIRKEDSLTSMGCRRVITLDSFLMVITKEGLEKKFFLPNYDPHDFFCQLKEACPQIKIGCNNKTDV